jgi:hypothetical protein
LRRTSLVDSGRHVSAHENPGIDGTSKCTRWLDMSQITRTSGIYASANGLQTGFIEELDARGLSHSFFGVSSSRGRSANPACRRITRGEKLVIAGIGRSGAAWTTLARVWCRFLGVATQRVRSHPPACGGVAELRSAARDDPITRTAGGVLPDRQAA